jgi:sigma-54 specific flagellar transcriptional regulator A
MNQGNDLLDWVGNSSAIQNVYTLIQQVAKTESNVLILGESGTGKELVARRLHAESKRHAGPFIAVNCAAIPSELLESELFGHEKGAFTSAYVARQGKFELANGGTLFLDEIGDMPLAMQSKLLRVLQERAFERVGGNRVLRADVRIVSATHKNLEGLLKEGQFREDLYYRLNVFPIEIPPLRERSQDILPLLNYFKDKCEKVQNVSFALSLEAVALLEQYGWPGNVRELANFVERLSILFPNKTVQVVDLPHPYGLQNVNKIKALNQPGMDLKEQLSKFEYTMITQVLKEHHGVVAKAAESLGVRRTTLTEKMKKYGILRKYPGNDLG